jgi:hypothetical protein
LRKADAAKELRVCRLGGDNAWTSLAVSCDTRDVLILMYMPFFLMLFDEVKGENAELLARNCWGVIA